MAFTFFFRDLQVLELAVEHARPIVSGRTFARVWDAGCAMGPEPYSLAMIFAEKLGPFAYQNLRIHASDLDDCDTFGPVISDGVYADPELERIPAQIRASYFEPAGRAGFSRVVEKIRKKIHFQKHDLLSLEPIGEGFSLIVCKNVLLHFSPAQRVQVIRMFHAALAPEGLLAMEQTQKLPEALSGMFQRVASEAELYRRVDG